MGPQRRPNQWRRLADCSPKQAPGEPIWDTVAKYLRDIKTVKIDKLNTPKLKGVEGNPGLADYPGMG